MTAPRISFSFRDRQRLGVLLVDDVLAPGDDVLCASACWIAMWVINRVGAAPYQCFSPGSKKTRSPGRITSTGPPSR
jgi:hypothetical protein